MVKMRLFGLYNRENSLRRHDSMEKVMALEVV